MEKSLERLSLALKFRPRLSLPNTGSGRPRAGLQLRELPRHWRRARFAATRAGREHDADSRNSEEQTGWQSLRIQLRTIQEFQAYEVEPRGPSMTKEPPPSASGKPAAIFLCKPLMAMSQFAFA